MSWLYPKQLVLSKRISETDYYPNPFFHLVTTICQLAFSFTIGNKNMDGSGDWRNPTACNEKSCADILKPHMSFKVFHDLL